MNTIKTGQCAALLLGMTLVTAAQAMEPGPARYRAELDRCLDVLRASVEDAATTKIRYIVRDVEKQGAWFRFDIRAETYHAASEIPARTEDSRCRARRWSEATEIVG
jgi:hypothetical protein